MASEIKVFSSCRDDPLLSEAENEPKSSHKEIITLGCSAQHIKIRIKEEYILLKRWALLLFGYFLALMYPYPILMRNLGFYLHHTMKDYVQDETTLKQKSLHDLGHQVRKIA